MYNFLRKNHFWKRIPKSCMVFSYIQCEFTYNKFAQTVQLGRFIDRIKFYLIQIIFLLIGKECLVRTVNLSRYIRINSFNLIREQKKSLSTDQPIASKLRKKCKISLYKTAQKRSQSGSMDEVNGQFYTAYLSNLILGLKFKFNQIFSLIHRGVLVGQPYEDLFLHFSTQFFCVSLMCFILFASSFFPACQICIVGPSVWYVCPEWFINLKIFIIQNVLASSFPMSMHALSYINHVNMPPFVTY